MSRKIAQEIEQARREAEEYTNPVEPNEVEKRAGWTVETLTAYIAERNAAATLHIDINSAYRRHKPHEQNHRYKPHRWRA